MSPVAIPFLVAALNDEDIEVQRAAAGRLAELSPVVPLDEHVVGLLLGHRDPSVAWQAISDWAYGGTAPIAAVPFLTQLLQDPLACRKFRFEDQDFSEFPEWDTRNTLVRALGTVQPPAVDVLLAASHDESPAVRRLAAEILAEQAADDPRTVVALRNLLHDGEHLTRIAAAGLLIKLCPNDTAAGHELLSALESAAETSMEAHRILHAIHPPFAGEVEFLCGLLDRREPGRAEGAADLLGELGPHAGVAIPRLLRLLDNAHSTGTLSVITALGRIGSREAVPRFITALSHPDPSIRVEAARALWRTEPSEQAIDVLIDNIQDIESYSFDSAAEAIAEIGPPAARAVPLLIDSLKPGDAFFAIFAKSLVAKALGAIGPASEPAIPYLLRAVLCNVPVLIHPHAAQALGQIGDRGIAPLVEALSDNSIRTRVRVAEAIGEIGPAATAAVPGLVAMLDDMDLAAQVSAAEALGHIGKNASPAKRALRNLLGSKSNLLRCTARHALERIAGIEIKPFR